MGIIRGRKEGKGKRRKTVRWIQNRIQSLKQRSLTKRSPKRTLIVLCERLIRNLCKILNPHKKETDMRLPKECKRIECPDYVFDSEGNEYCEAEKCPEGIRTEKLKKEAVE